jgi:hypothetical protein
MSALPWSGHLPKTDGGKSRPRPYGQSGLTQGRPRRSSFGCASRRRRLPVRTRPRLHPRPAGLGAGVGRQCGVFDGVQRLAGVLQWRMSFAYSAARPRLSALLRAPLLPEMLTASEASLSSLSRDIDYCLIMILAHAVVRSSGNGDDRALRVAEAVVTHRTGDESADADMLLGANNKQRCL